MKSLSQFQNFHQNETLVVCGCGESLNDLVETERFITIGVNDVGRRFQPNYLVVVNPPEQFSGDRFRYVETSRAEYLFTQLDLGVEHPNIVKFPLGEFGGTDFSNPDVLHYTDNSPYIALCLAIQMGAKRIGLIGIDFTDNHFFAKTGTHPLAPRLEAINEQYRRLNIAAGEIGVEIFNLSGFSRLTVFPKMSPEEFAAGNALTQTAETFDKDGTARELVRVTKPGITDIPEEFPVHPAARTLERARPKVFGVNYHFLACGDVFDIGLRDAAEQLGVTYEDALWDDSTLPAKIERFQPELIFVVHGRRFVQKWGDRFSQYQTAVWLVDEPYEVDDTAGWSDAFRTVFVNDPNTISRHRNAHYLPACFNARAHLDKDLPRIHKVGFIGGFNETRERYLNRMVESGLLSYVVGGPWKSSELRRLCLGNNVPPKRTTELYQQTQVVVNVFRDIHHFNQAEVAARSMNPRIYEALACGALVISEARPEISEVFPELPTFDNQDSMIQTLRHLIFDESYRRNKLEKSRARLNGHSYQDRLAEVLRVCLKIDVERAITIPAKEETPDMNTDTITVNSTAKAADAAVIQNNRETPLREWLSHGETVEISGSGEVTILKPYSNEPGSETGLVSQRSYNDVELSFDLRLDDDTWFIAKIHQLDQIDQKMNSYHVVCEPASSYVAKHNLVLERLPLSRGVWQKIMFRWVERLIEVFVNNKSVARIPENQLQSGYCFVGVKGGRAQLKNLRLTDLSEVQTARSNAADSNGSSKKNFSRDSQTLQTGKPPPPGAELYPFTAMPRRNLIYHIYPVRGSIWAWNLDQLKRRLDLFNGKRILGIVYDERSVAPERVQEYLDGHGFEFIIEKNNAQGEAITFPHMMRKIASEHPDEVTFYGHAKGVKYEPSVPATVRRWTEVQYRVALDDWMTVREQLQRFAMTGPFKMLGRFSSHRHLADWHYSGTYFWMRNAHVFSRNYSDVPQFYGGVETFPGIIFSKEETTCLFMDNLTIDNPEPLPYYEQFWSNKANHCFNQWESAARSLPPPPELVQPLPYKGYTEPRMEQKPDEFAWWVNRLLDSDISRVLTIGSNKGGAEWHLAREFFEQGRKIEINAIEKNPTAQLVQTFQDAERRFHQTLKLIPADSTSASIKEQLSEQYDAVFIDGDHSYRGCLSDFTLAKSLKPKFIGLHDIVDSDWHAYARCCVSRLWTELSQQYRTECKADGEWGGIGVVILD
jgi:spore maturation protein CgeB